MSISDTMADLITHYDKQIEVIENRRLLSETTAQIHIGVLHQRIEAAKQRLESLNGEQVWQADLDEVIEILEGKQ